MGNSNKPSRDEIEDAIIDILRRDGPDGHIDGYEIIADYVEAVLEGRAGEWLRKYADEERRRG